VRRWLLIVGLLIPVGIGGLSILDARNEAARADRHAEALANLPQREIGEILELDEGSGPDLVVFQDDADGWFELHLSDAPADLEIGVYGPRFLELLTGMNHTPMFCGGDAGPGKIMYVIEARRIARSVAYCNPRRLDLGPLRAYAAPVALESRDFTAAELIPLETRILSDAALDFVSWPDDPGPYTHQRIVTGPYTWWAQYATNTARLAMERELQAAILAVIGGGDVVIRDQPDTGGQVEIGIEGQTISGSGVVRGRELLILETLRLRAYEIEITCRPAACAALDKIDFNALFVPGRDQDLLQEALDGAAITSFGVRNRLMSAAIDRLVPQRHVQLSDLEAATARVSETAPLRYPVRYIRRGDAGTD